jgi:hypothetical protein
VIDPQPASSQISLVNMARVSIRLLLLAGSAIILLGVLGLTTWLSMEAGRDEAGELFDARLATSARVLDSLMARQIEHATINAPLVMSLPAPIREEARKHEQRRTIRCRGAPGVAPAGLAVRPSRRRNAARP